MYIYMTGQIKKLNTSYKVRSDQEQFRPKRKHLPALDTF